MPRKCTICSNKQRRAIDAEIDNNAVLRGIARTYQVSEDSVERHVKNCISRELNEAKELGLIKRATDKVESLTPVMSTARRVEYAFGLIGQIIQRKTNSDGMVEMSAEELTILLREMRGWNEQSAKLNGEYIKAAENPTNVEAARKLLAIALRDPRYGALEPQRIAEIIAQERGLDPATVQVDGVQ